MLKTLARRLRRETTMPLKWICQRLEMGSWKSVNRRLESKTDKRNVDMLGTDPFTAAQGRPGEDHPGAAVAAGNDDAAEMDLPAAGNGVLEIRQPEAL